MKNIIKLMIEKKELESQYGSLSCFDYPKEYERMEELTTEINKLIKQEVNVDAPISYIYEVLDKVALDIMNNNNIHLDEIEIYVYSQDDFIEFYILEGMDESARNMFDSLFYFMDSDHRAAWIKANYIAGDPNLYTNQFIDFVVVVNY